MSTTATDAALHQALLGESKQDLADQVIRWRRTAWRLMQRLDLLESQLHALHTEVRATAQAITDQPDRSTPC